MQWCHRIKNADFSLRDCQDGSFYLQVCGAAVKQSDGAKLNSGEELGALYCGSYIGGFLDAMSLASTLSKGNKIVCTPEQGITNDQAARIFVKYLRETPETLHQTGRMSLYVALAKAFPCMK
jgi:Rap1a immunity proteins